EVDLAFPTLGVVHIARLRRDVEVPEHREIWHLALPEPASQRFVPAQLVRVFLGPWGLAVRCIQADDANAIDRGVHAALQVVRKVRDAMRDVGDWYARQDRDAVVRLLSAEHGFITSRAQLSDREVRVLGLRLLQARYIWPRITEPIEQMRQPNAKRID